MPSSDMQQFDPDYKQGIDLAKTLVDLLQDHSPAAYENAICLFETFRVHCKAAEASFLAANNIFKAAGENFNRTLNRATHYRDQYYSRLTEYDARCHTLNTLRHQHRATSEASHKYDVQRKHLRVEYRALSRFLRDIQQTWEKLAVCDCKVEKRRQELRVLCDDMEQKKKGFQKLEEDQNDILKRMNAVEEMLGLGAA